MYDYAKKNRFKLFVIRLIDRLSFFIGRKSIFTIWKANQSPPEAWTFVLILNSFNKFGWEYIDTIKCIDVENAEKGAQYFVLKKRVGRIERKYFANLVALEMSNFFLKLNELMKTINKAKETIETNKTNKSHIDQMKNPEELEKYLTGLFNLEEE